MNNKCPKLQEKIIMKKITFAPSATLILTFSAQNWWSLVIRLLSLMFKMWSVAGVNFKLNWGDAQGVCMYKTGGNLWGGRRIERVL